MQIELSEHARAKLSILRSHNVDIKEEQINETLLHPESVLNGWGGRLVAQRVLDESHVLRVVYIKEQENKIRVITV